ncbi:gastrula zinc finger protein XlCGF57.1-like [Helicoverpa zea]|uniref:gastrula zinc finger protein XlCGF57.1-like n=1 Tax=Helicoverpa zea TaxID=7113 RepID=UPI001F57A715|nr:gastrula zinc finger protein XlCGF57.1-like [Helicoverpa zea]
MNDNEYIHCRLCAHFKPKYSLIHLISEEPHCQDIVKWLSRFNVQINLNDNNLPKMACITCIASLERAFDFIAAVERAQSTLNDIILQPQLVKEEHFSDDENIVYEGPADYDNEIAIIKVESNKTDSTSEISVENNIENSSEEKKKRLLCTSVDNLPLAQVHMSWKDFQWLCSHCETQFPTSEELQIHSMQHHKVCNPYQCTDCKAKIFRLDRFLKHVKLHRKYLKFSCYKCHLKFFTSKDCLKHTDEHKETDYVCSGCNENFECQQELDEHTSTYCRGSVRKETIGEEPVIVGDSLTCTVCNKTYMSKKTLITHMWIHTRKQKSYTCDVCGKSFYQKGNLQDHILHHSDSRPYQCEICKSSYKTKRGLRSHITSHNAEKPFACDQCGKCFRLKKQLSNHSIVHTDSYPHVCSYCNKGFRFKPLLTLHLRQHTGVKPYSCEICQREFTNWSNYNKHMKRLHNTDMAKTKHTPQKLPIDPVTEVFSNKAFEEKKKILELSKKGRCKKNAGTDKGKDKNSNNKE